MPTPDMFVFQIGGDAVLVFFFISGYIVPLAYEKYYLTSENNLSPIRFYISRALKIFPIYWIAVTITFFDYKLWNFTNAPNPELISPENLIHNYLLIGLGWRRANDLGSNLLAQAWTLDYELQWYLLIPVLFWLRKYKLDLMVCGFIFAFNGFGLSNSFFTHSSFFILGYLFYRGSAEINKESNELVFLKSKIWNHPLLYFSIAFLFFSIVQGSHTMTSISLIGIAMVCLIKQHHGETSKIDKLMGDLSYPVYILHMSTLYISQNYLIVGWDKFLGFEYNILFDVLFFFAQLGFITIEAYLCTILITYPLEKLRLKLKSKSI